MRLWLPVLVVLGLVALVRSGPSQQDVLARLPDAGNPKRVLMVSAEWCGYCQRQIADFKSAGVGYTVLDFDQHEGRSLVADLGGRGVPLTVIGDEVINGYNRPLLKQQLAAIGYTLR
jgi:mycoredoxin